MTTHTQTNYYLEVSIASKDFACQVFKLNFTPASRGAGKPEYPACPPAQGQAASVVITPGEHVDGSAEFELWHDTTATGITTALIEAQQADEPVDYVFVYRFDDPQADYQWTGAAKVQPIALAWDRTTETTHRGPVRLTILTSLFGRPAPRAAA